MGGGQRAANPGGIARHGACRRHRGGSRSLVSGGVVGGIVFVFAAGFTSPSVIAAGIAYGLLISLSLGGVSLFVLEGSLRDWLGSLSFTANLIVRSTIYAAILVPILFFQLGSVIVGQTVAPANRIFWISILYNVRLLVVFNLTPASVTSSGVAHC